MTSSDAASTAAERAASLLGRAVRAWRLLTPERRPAALASVGLFVSLFLPWYQQTVITTKVQTASLTGWAGFSFVEAAILIVATGVLLLLMQRAEGRAFHIPGGDGGVIMAAGIWACVLVVWRIFDKQGATTHGQYSTTTGIEWGIFVALAAGALLAYSGNRIRAAHRPEPPLPGEPSEQPPGGPPPPRGPSPDQPPPGPRSWSWAAESERAGSKSRPDEQLTTPLENDEPH